MIHRFNSWFTGLFYSQGTSGFTGLFPDSEVYSWFTGLFSDSHVYLLIKRFIFRFTGLFPDSEVCFLILRFIWFTGYLWFTGLFLLTQRFTSWFTGSFPDSEVYFLILSFICFAGYFLIYKFIFRFKGLLPDSLVYFWSTDLFSCLFSKFSSRFTGVFHFHRIIPDSQVYFLVPILLADCMVFVHRLVSWLCCLSPSLGKPQKSSYLNGRAIKRGGWGRAGPLRKKGLFFGTFFSNVPKFQRLLSSRGGGGLGLNGRPLREELFFAASLSFLGFRTNT